jgi:hypothetical protein
LAGAGAAPATSPPIKLLWWTGDGLCLLAKRLERGRFIWTQTTSGTVTLTQAQLSMLLEGIDWRQHLAHANHADLPNDIDVLRALLLAAEQTVRERDAVIAARDEVVPGTAHPADQDRGRDRASSLNNSSLRRPASA